MTSKFDAKSTTRAPWGKRSFAAHAKDLAHSIKSGPSARCHEILNAAPQGLASGVFS